MDSGFPPVEVEIVPKGTLARLERAERERDEFRARIEALAKEIDRDAPRPGESPIGRLGRFSHPDYIVRRLLESLSKKSEDNPP